MPSTRPSSVSPSSVSVRAIPKSVILAVCSLRAQQHVLGLHVAVHDVVFVRRPQRPRDLDRVRDRLGDLKRAGAADQRLQRLPVHVLEDDVRRRGAGPRFLPGIPIRGIFIHLLAGVDHSHDVRVAELRHRASLAAKALQLVGVRGDLAVHQLDRHRPFQHRVEGAVHRRHPALADLLVEAVAPAERSAEHRLRHHPILRVPQAGAGSSMWRSRQMVMHRRSAHAAEPPNPGSLDDDYNAIKAIPSAPPRPRRPETATAARPTGPCRGRP